MTRKRKKSTIITETDRVLILNRHSGAVEGWCDDCSDLASMVRPEEAVAWAAFRLGSAPRVLKLRTLQGATPEPSEGSLDAWFRPA